MHVRRANENDCKDIWEWWNDPVTRQMMKDNKPVPFEQHLVWFNNAIVDPNRALFVAEHDGVSLGIVRFLYEIDAAYEVSINLAPNERGKGYGSKILEMSISSLLTSCEVSILYATLKKINIASKRTFEKNNFVFCKPSVVYPKMKEFDTENEYYCELKV